MITDGTELTKLVCSNIRKIRKEKGMTQVKASERLGVSRQQFALFENGTRMPRPQNLCDIAQVLSCNVLDFYKELDSETKESLE